MWKNSFANFRDASPKSYTRTSIVRAIQMCSSGTRSLPFVDRLIMMRKPKQFSSRLSGNLCDSDYVRARMDHRGSILRRQSTPLAMYWNNKHSSDGRHLIPTIDDRQTQCGNEASFLSHTCLQDDNEVLSFVVLFAIIQVLEHCSEYLHESRWS